MYFVSVPGVSARGSVTSSRLAVKKGQPVTIAFEPGSGYLLTEVKDNGASIYDEVYDNSVDCRYTFTPTSDVNIEATFTPFPKDSRVNVLLPLRAGGEPVLTANVVIYGDGNLFRYNLTTNSKGNAVLELPKAGTYDVGGKQIAVSGNYRVVVAAEGYHDEEFTFTLNDETTSVSVDGKQQSVAVDKAFTRTVTLKETRYGTVTVNGVTLNSDAGIKHNPETDNYYSDGGVRTAYLKDSAASDYVVTFDTAFSSQTKTGTDPVAGGVIASGSRVLVMKGCWWEGNRLCIASGANTNTSNELSFSGFNNTIGDNGNLRFTVAKYEQTLYIYDADGTLKVWLGADGVHTIGGVEYRVNRGSVEDFTKDLGEFFGAGDDNAIGFARYGSTGTTEWAVERATGTAYDYVSGGDFTFESETADYTATVSGSRVGAGFVKGSTVKIEVKATNPDKAASKMRLGYGEGEHTDIAGEYDAVKGVTVFEFTAREAYTATISEYENLVALSGAIISEGATDYSGATIEVEGSGALDGIVKADGTFSVKVISGTYNIRAAMGDKVAYVIGANVTSALDLGEITLNSGKFDFAESAVVNGKTVDTFAAAPSYALRSEALIGSIAALGNNKLYVMPGTTTASDYVYTVNMKGIEAFAGMGITDGASVISFQIVSWEAGGQNLVLECDEIGYSRNTVEVRFPASANANADATYTVVKTSDSIVLCSGSGDKTTWLMRITADGYEFNGGTVVERSIEGRSSLVRLEAQQDRLAGFFGENVENMAVLYRNDVGGSKASYTLGFEETTAAATAITITRGDGTTPGEGRIVLKSDKACYVYDADGAAFTAKVPYGTYDIEYVGGGYAAYKFGVTVENGATVAITANDATLMPGASVTLNGRTYGGYNGAKFVTNAMKASTLESGSTTIAAGHNSAYAFVLPGTKTAGEYEFTSRLLNENGNRNMGGIGVTNGRYALSFQLSSGEKSGRRLVIELAENWCGNDFVLNCESTDTDNVWTAEKLDATITLRRYADRIEVYVGRETVSKVVTVTKDGYVFANSGWTVNNTARVEDHKAKLADFFGENAEHAMTYASNYMADEMTYTSQFKVIEYHDLSASVDFLDGNETASGTLTFRNERGVVNTFAVAGGDNTVSLPYGTYSYVFTAAHYEQKSGTITFGADNTSLGKIEVNRYIDETLLTATENESEIVFNWTENATDIDGYKLVRKGETDTVIASTDDGLTAENGTFTVAVDKGASGYVAGATYELIVTPKTGKLAPPADTFAAIEFGYGVINDNSTADKAARFVVTGEGVTSGFDGGLKLSGGDNVTAHIKSLRTCDLGKANFINIRVSGGGNATIAGKAVTLSANGGYVNLTPAEYNGGEFDVTFSGSITIGAVTIDALDDGLSTSWNETAGCGVVTRNEDGSYTITESDTGSKYSFTSLAMDKSVNFTISARVTVKTVAGKGAQHGFTISSPLDGKARGAMVYDTKDDAVWILSYIPGWTYKQIFKGGDGWLMNDEDYAAIDKTNFRLTMVRDNATLYMLVNDKPLAYIDTEATPLFIAAEGSTEAVSIKGVPLVTGFASRNVQGSASDPLDTATYSDLAVKLTAEHSALTRTSGTISGANANTKIYIGKIGGVTASTANADGTYSVLAPAGSTIVACDGEKAAFLGSAAGTVDGTMIDARYMTEGTYDEQKASAEGAGVYEISKLRTTLPLTATASAFEFGTAITVTDTSKTDGMSGVSITNKATGTKISVQSVRWNSNGAHVMLDVQRKTEGTNDYAVDCFSANVFKQKGEMNVGFKISRTADKIVIAAGPDGSELKVATITASGIAFADDWKVSDTARKTANDEKCAEFFTDGAVLTVGYDSYDRKSNTMRYTSKYKKVSLVDVTGTAGAANGTLNLVAESGAIYELAVTDGVISGKAPEGTYKVRLAGNGACVTDAEVTIADGTPVTLTAATEAVTAIKGGAVSINGKTVYATSLPETEAAASAIGSVTLKNNTKNFYYMPNTLTDGDFEYTVNMKNTTRMAGLAIYDGSSRLTIQLAAWESGGKRVIMDCAANMGNDFVLNVTGATNTSADSTFTVRKENATLTVYMGAGDGKIEVLTVSSDGTITLADGVTAVDSAKFATKSAAQKSLLANFLKSGTQTMVGLGRNDAVSQTVTYTPSFKTL